MEYEEANKISSYKEYAKWLEEKYFHFLETDGLITYDECPDENPEVREEKFKEWKDWQRYLHNEDKRSIYNTYNKMRKEADNE
tara:strand:+ start:180 stop:428 length:249 start_codon:yes stop_codon:yes gene_type:complete